MPEKRIKLLDGNCIEKSQHRIEELKLIALGPLPGKSLVTYNPVLGMPIDIFPCEDGRAQECSLLKAVRSTVEPADVLIADRAFKHRNQYIGLSQGSAVWSLYYLERAGYLYLFRL